jgi:hypothetical protein
MNDANCWYNVLLEWIHLKQNEKTARSRNRRIVDLVAYAAELASYGYSEEEIIEILGLEP